MYFMIKDKKRFDKYIKIWEKVSNTIKIKFNSELMYNKQYLKAKKIQCKWKLLMILYTSNTDWLSL